MKTVQITVEVKRIRTDKAAEEFAQHLAEHVMETFNDDDSIAACHYKTVPNRPRANPLTPEQQRALVDALTQVVEHEIEQHDESRNFHNDDIDSWADLLQSIVGQPFPHTDSRHRGVACAQCNGIIEDEEAGQSTFCGSIHTACMSDHCAQCDVCAAEEEE